MIYMEGATYLNFPRAFRVYSVGRFFITYKAIENCFSRDFSRVGIKRISKKNFEKLLGN